MSVWPSGSGSSSSSSDLKNYGKHLEPFRVNLRNLSRRDQYQVSAHVGSRDEHSN